MKYKKMDIKCFFSNKNIFFLLFSIVITVFIVNAFLKKTIDIFQHSKLTEEIVEIEALEKWNKNAQGSEIHLKRIVIDYKTYNPQALIEEGEWNFEAGQLRWRTYDNKGEITNLVKLKIPSGHKRELIFDSNIYRGMSRIKSKGFEKEVDFYSDIQTERIIELHDNKAFSSIVKIFILISLSMIIFVLIFTFTKLYFSSKCIIEYFVFMVFSFVITRTFTTYPFSQVTPYSDSAVFIYVGKAMNRGLLPYKQIYDIKGIVYFAIQWLSELLFDNYLGIWIFETIAIFVFFLYSYKSIRIILNGRWEAVFLTLSVVPILPHIFMNGNFTEIISFALIAMSLYYMTNFFDTNFEESNIKYKFLQLGITGAMALFIKINMVTSWIVIGFSCLIFFVKEKKVHYVKMMVKYIIIGAIIPLSIISLYFTYNNLWGDVWKVAILPNIYHGKDSQTLLYIIEYYSKNIYVLFSVITGFSIILFKIFNQDISFVFKNTYYIGTIYFGLLFSLIACSRGGAIWHHYTIILFPYLVIINAFGYLIIKYFINKRRKDLFTGILVGGYVVTIITWFHFIYPNYLWHLNGHNSDEDMYVSYLIKQNTSDNEPVLINGFKPELYLMAERNASTKYLYYAKMGGIDSYEPLYLDISEKKPKIFVDTLSDFKSDDSKGILENELNNNYKLIYSNGVNRAVYLRK